MKPYSSKARALPPLETSKAKMAICGAGWAPGKPTGLSFEGGVLTGEWCLAKAIKSHKNVQPST